MSPPRSPFLENGGPRDSSATGRDAAKLDDLINGAANTLIHTDFGLRSEIKDAAETGGA